MSVKQELSSLDVRERPVNKGLGGRVNINAQKSPRPSRGFLSRSLFDQYFATTIAGPLSLSRRPNK